MWIVQELPPSASRWLPGAFVIFLASGCIGSHTQGAAAWGDAAAGDVSTLPTDDGGGSDALEDAQVRSLDGSGSRDKDSDVPGVPDDGTDIGDAGWVGDGSSAGDSATQAPCSCLVPGVTWRFHKLHLDSIDNGTHLVQGALNPLWNKDIQAGEINIFAEVLTVKATEVTIRIISAARLTGTASSLCLLPATQGTVVLPRQGCALGPSTPSALDIYAGTEAHPKHCAPTLPYPGVAHVIPVRGAVLSAHVADDCKLLTNGLISDGHLAKAALAATCVCLTTGSQAAETCGTPDDAFVGNSCDGCNKKYQNLLTLLKSFSGEKQDLDYLCEDGSQPAACLTASFAGERVVGLPAACPVP